MDSEQFQSTLQQPVQPRLLLLLGILFLVSLYGVQRWLDKRLQIEKRTLDTIALAIEPLQQNLQHYQSLRDLKVLDVAQFKAGFTDQALSNKTLFESGLSLQEERRLLEKQLEIMTTYLTIDPTLQRLFLMRGQQPLESYQIDYFPPRVFTSSGALVALSSDTVVTVSSTTALMPLPGVVRIVSKERFANPERGRSEQVNGVLQYSPPQVGTSIRSNALGEYVMFTNSKWILHGPPVNQADHEIFPHICLGLNLDTARKLYRSSFIGTKILPKRWN